MAYNKNPNNNNNNNNNNNTWLCLLAHDVLPACSTGADASMSTARAAGPNATSGLAAGSHALTAAMNTAPPTVASRKRVGQARTKVHSWSDRSSRARPRSNSATVSTSRDTKAGARDAAWGGGRAARASSWTIKRAHNVRGYVATLESEHTGIGEDAHTTKGGGVCTRAPTRA